MSEDKSHFSYPPTPFEEYLELLQWLFSLMGETLEWKDQQHALITSNLMIKLQSAGCAEAKLATVGDLSTSSPLHYSTQHVTKLP